MQKKKIHWLGNRQFYRTAMALGIPLMFQQLITSSVNLVDNLMVGQLGNTALSSVAAVNRLTMVAIFAVNGLLAAAAIFIAQFWGAEDREPMKQTFRFSLLAAFLILVPFWLGETLIPEQLLSFFTDVQDVIKTGSQYMVIAAWALPFTAFSLSTASAMRAAGQPRLPLGISAGAVLINTLLNYLLIFGKGGFPVMGVQGAALATVMARLIEALLHLYFLVRKSFPFTTRLRELFVIPRSLAWSILKKALPLTLNEFLWSLGMATLFMLYSQRGPEIMAGYSIANTISDLFFVLFGGLATATTILVSKPLGANQMEEARERAYQLLAFSIFLAVLFSMAMFGASFIVPAWYQVSVQTRQIAAQMLQVMAVMFWTYTANTQCYFILRAGGDTRSTLFVDSGFMWLVNIPLIGLLTCFTSMNIMQMYLIGQMTELAKLSIAYHLVRKEKWLVNLTQ